MTRQTTITTVEEIEDGHRRVRQERTDTLRFRMSEQPQPLWPDGEPLRRTGDMRTIDGVRWICKDIDNIAAYRGGAMAFGGLGASRDDGYGFQIVLEACGPAPTPQELAGATVALVEDHREGETYRDAWRHEDREREGTRIVVWVPGTAKADVVKRGTKLVLKVVD